MKDAKKSMNSDSCTRRRSIGAAAKNGDRNCRSFMEIVMFNGHRGQEEGSAFVLGLEGRRRGGDEAGFKYLMEILIGIFSYLISYD